MIPFPEDLKHVLVVRISASEIGFHHAMLVSTQGKSRHTFKARESGI
jgi:hypothetical protein